MEKRTIPLIGSHKYFTWYYVDPNKGYYDASHEFYELRKELKTKGVSLSKADTLKAFEVFLRSMLGYKYNQNSYANNKMMGTFQTINPLFAIAQLQDDEERCKSEIEITSELVEYYRQYYKNIQLYIDYITKRINNSNYCMEKSSNTLQEITFALAIIPCSKISKLDDVLDNLDIILPEFYRFYGEIVDTLIEMYNSSDGQYRDISFEKTIQISENEYPDSGTKVAIVRSNAIAVNNVNRKVDLLKEIDLKYEVHSYDPIMGSKQK